MPFAHKVLADQLEKEEKNLSFFVGNLKSADPMTVKQAEGSIPSCTHRLNELKLSIEFLKTYKKT